MPICPTYQETKVKETLSVNKTLRIKSWNENSPEVREVLGTLASSLSSSSKYNSLSASTPELCKIIKKRDILPILNNNNHNHRRIKHKIDQLLETCENIFITNLRNMQQQTHHGGNKTEIYLANEIANEGSNKLHLNGYLKHTDKFLSTIDMLNTDTTAKSNSLIGNELDEPKCNLVDLTDNEGLRIIEAEITSMAAPISTTLRKKKLLHRYRILPNLKSFTSNFNSTPNTDVTVVPTTSTTDIRQHQPPQRRTTYDNAVSIFHSSKTGDCTENGAKLASASSRSKTSKKTNGVSSSTKIFRVGSYRKKLMINRTVNGATAPAVSSDNNSLSKFYPTRNSTNDNVPELAKFAGVFVSSSTATKGSVAGLIINSTKGNEVGSEKMNGKMSSVIPVITMNNNNNNNSSADSIIKMNVFNAESKDDEELERGYYDFYESRPSDNNNLLHPSFTRNHVFYVPQDVTPFTASCTLCGNYLTCKTFKCKYCHNMFHEQCARNSKECPHIRSSCLSMSMLDQRSTSCCMTTSPDGDQWFSDVDTRLVANQLAFLRPSSSFKNLSWPRDDDFITTTTNFRDNPPESSVNNTVYPAATFPADTFDNTEPPSFATRESLRELLNKSFDGPTRIPFDESITLDPNLVYRQSHQTVSPLPLLQKMKSFGSSDDVTSPSFFSRTLSSLLSDGNCNTVSAITSITLDDPLVVEQLNLKNNPIPNGGSITTIQKARQMTSNLAVDNGIVKCQTKSESFPQLLDQEPQQIGNEIIYNETTRKIMDVIESQVEKFIDSSGPTENMVASPAQQNLEDPELINNSTLFLTNPLGGTAVPSISFNPNTIVAAITTTTIVDFSSIKNISQFPTVFDDQFLRYDILNLEPGSVEEQWPKFRSNKNLTKHMNSKDIKRQDVINELIQSEKLHLQTLSIILKIYSFALKHVLQIPEVKLQCVFPRVESLYEIHYAFYQHLRKRQSQGPVIENIGDILYQQFTGDTAAQMKFEYGLFCSEHKSAINAFKYLLKTDKNLNTFMQEALSHQLCRRKSVPECILAITQRITKYPIFLESIIKANKGKKHKIDQMEDDEKVCKALHGLRCILTHVDEQIAHKEMQERLVDIIAKIDSKSFTTFEGSKFTKMSMLSLSRSVKSISAGTPDEDSLSSSVVSGPLSTPFVPNASSNLDDGGTEISNQIKGLDIENSQAARYLIHEGGPLEVGHAGLGGITKGKHALQVYLLLFNDILVFLQESSNTKYGFINTSENVQMSSVLSLNKLIFREKAGEPTVFYVINCQPSCPEMYEVSCDTTKTKSLWMLKLRKALAKASIVPDTNRTNEIKRNSLQMEEDFKKMQNYLDKIKKWIGEAELMDRDMDVILSQKHVALNNIIDILESQVSAALTDDAAAFYSSKMSSNNNTNEQPPNVLETVTSSTKSIPTAAATAVPSNTNNNSLKSSSGEQQTILVHHRKSLSQEAGLINAFFDKFKREIDQSCSSTSTGGSTGGGGGGGLFKHMNFGGNNSSASMAKADVLSSMANSDDSSLNALTSRPQSLVLENNNGNQQSSPEYNNQRGAGNLVKLREFLRKFIDQVNIHNPSPTSTINLNRSVSDVLDTVKPNYDFFMPSSSYFVSDGNDKSNFLPFNPEQLQQPKRAETFSGFDSKGNFNHTNNPHFNNICNKINYSQFSHHQFNLIKGINKLRLNTLNEQNENGDLILMGGKRIPTGNLTTTEAETLNSTPQTNAGLLSSSSTSSLNSPHESSNVSSKTSLVSSPVSAASYSSNNVFNLKDNKDIYQNLNISPPSSSNNHLVSFPNTLSLYMNEISRLKFIEIMEILQNFVNHEITNQTKIMSENQELRCKLSKCESDRSERKSYTWHNQQLEELRNLQENVTKEKEALKKECETERTSLEVEKRVIKEQMEELKTAQTRLKADQELMEAQKLTIQQYWADIVNLRKFGGPSGGVLTPPTNSSQQITTLHLTLPDNNNHHNKTYPKSFGGLPSSHFYHSRSKSYEDNPFLISANAFSTTSIHSSYHHQQQNLVLNDGVSTNNINNNNHLAITNMGNPARPYSNYSNNNASFNRRDVSTVAFNATGGVCGGGGASSLTKSFTALPSHLISSTNEKKMYLMPAATNIAQQQQYQQQQLQQHNNFEMMQNYNYPISRGAPPGGLSTTNHVIHQSNLSCNNNTVNLLHNGIGSNSFSFSFKRYQDWKEHYDSGANHYSQQQQHQQHNKSMMPPNDNIINYNRNTNIVIANNNDSNNNYNNTTNENNTPLDPPNFSHLLLSGSNNDNDIALNISSKSEYPSSASSPKLRYSHQQYNNNPRQIPKQIFAAAPSTEGGGSFIHHNLKCHPQHHNSSGRYNNHLHDSTVVSGNQHPTAMQHQSAAPENVQQYHRKANNGIDFSSASSNNNNQDDSKGRRFLYTRGSTSNLFSSKNRSKTQILMTTSSSVIPPETHKANDYQINLSQHQLMPTKLETGNEKSLPLCSSIQPYSIVDHNSYDNKNLFKVPRGQQKDRNLTTTSSFEPNYSLKRIPFKKIPPSTENYNQSVLNNNSNNYYKSNYVSTISPPSSLNELEESSKNAPLEGENITSSTPQSPKYVQSIYYF